VEVAEDGIDVDDALAVELEDDPEHAVGRGVLGPMLMSMVSWWISRVEAADGSPIGFGARSAVTTSSGRRAG
jgi:hypothetical protein